ncbi:hypothetical protein GJAV_G00121760 [Gymnothorax javanicus]|nr:hypothetical protein GJAV_G00121760 [Gymnothorax javanicus]
MDEEAAKKFCMKNRSHIIKKLSKVNTMAAADILLSKGHINLNDYYLVSEEGSEMECMRKLFKAMEKGNPKSYSTFHQHLVKEQPFILEELEKHARSETESEPLPKRPKIDEERVREPDQSQVQEGRDETDCGSNPNFAGCTLSRLLQHVEEPEQMERLVASLEQRLKEGQITEIESLLRSQVGSSELQQEIRRLEAEIASRSRRSSLAVVAAEKTHTPRAEPGRARAAVSAAAGSQTAAI